MSPPESLSSALDRVGRLPGLVGDEHGPLFAEPWQAEAFAMVLRLKETGHFTWREWTRTLAAVLAERPTDTDGSRYYDDWLTALERIVTAKRLLQAKDLDQRKVDWIEAYKATPHGKPVQLQPR